MQLADINPLELPSLPLADRKRLPNCSAIYFAISENGQILYIGKTESLVLRWMQHHRYSQLESMNPVRVAWLECPIDDLTKTEDELRETLAPLLNSKKRKPEPRTRESFSPPGKWGESKQRVNIMLTPTATARIDEVADALKLTRSEVLERLCRSECLNSKSLQEADK